MFSGVYTAIVTPFNEDGSVDYGCLRSLIDCQAAAGVAGIVPVGTTGESPTLSYEEHSRVIDVTIEACAGRMQVIAGTGANSTTEAIDLTKRAKDAGADGTLQVTPYYNKPNQEGLYRHFAAVADLGLPVVLYNVPGRSGMPIAIDTIKRLSEHPSVVCVKEAGGSVDRVSAIKSQCSIGVLSGDDALTLPMMAVGAEGVISVASNLIPEVMVELVAAENAGDHQKALEIHLAYHKLMSDMFLDTNPIPIKAAMAMKGLCQENYRLPLCETSDAVKEKLRQTLVQSGVLS
jgi:4-hydroxy-tetrahydrodipicolinate synthase